MFNSDLYKKHYPIQSQSDLYGMSDKDRKKLSEWVYVIEADVKNWNYRSALHGSTRGIEINYPGVKQLSQKIRAVNAAEISEADLGFINEVLYRHKYIFPLSLYFFPTEKGTKEK